MLLPVQGAESAATWRLPVEFSIRQWSGKDGLPLRSVEAILHTREGFLWFGMNTGLGRFDGEGFQVYDNRNTPELPVGYITALAEDPEGSLWIGSAGGGMASHRNGRFRRYTKEDGLLNEQVKGLLCAPDGTVWVATDGGGIFHRQKNDTFVHYGTNQGLASLSIMGLARDREGKIFAVDYAHGPYRLEEGTFRAVPMLPERAVGEGFGLTTSPEGQVWLGTTDGVYRYRDGAFHRWDEPRLISGEKPVIAWETRPSTMWVGTTDSLLQLESGVWTSYPINGGSSARFASAFALDPDGGIWLTTEGSGAVQLRRSKFVTFSQREGLADEVTTSVLQARDDSIWFGTTRGLHRFAQGRIETFGRDDGLADPFVFSLAEDDTGTLWVSTRMGGLYLFEKGVFQRLPAAEQPPVRAAWCLTRARDGSLWAGTPRGALQYRDRQRVQHLTGPATFSNDDVRCIAESPDGTLWFGTSYGLNRRTAEGLMKSYTVVTNAPTETELGTRTQIPPLEVVIALLAQPDGDLWIGTQGRGLFLLRGNEFHHFGPRAGLIPDIIDGIVDDGLGYLWLGTSQGILQISRRSFDAVLRGESTELAVRTFNRIDGLRTEECSGTIQPTTLRDRSGRLWFTTTDGLATIHPADVPVNRRPPVSHIERVGLEGPHRTAVLQGRTANHSELRIEAESVPLNSSTPSALQRAEFIVSGLESIVIPPGQDRIEFQYAGLSYVVPESITHRFRLEGFDRDWVEAGRRRVAHYTRVPPGKYHFMVRATNEDGVESQVGDKIEVLILPAWYQTRLFRGSVVLLGLGSVVGLVGWRVRALERKQRAASDLNRHLLRSQEAERTRIAAELHDGIGQELQLIRNRSELALERLSPDSSLSRELTSISGTVARAIQGVRALSRGLRPPELDQLGLTKTLEWLVHHASEACPARIDVRIDPVDQCLSPELELHFYRVAQEALNNAMKHGRAAEITVEVSRGLSSLTLSVFDNGRGFTLDEDSEAAQGSGLKTMQERAALLGGTLTVRSQPGVGTRLTLVVPARPPAAAS